MENTEFVTEIDEAKAIEFATLMARQWYGNFCQDEELLGDLAAFVDDESHMTGHRCAALRRHTEDVMGIDITQGIDEELNDFIAADEPDDEPEPLPFVNA